MKNWEAIFWRGWAWLNSISLDHVKAVITPWVIPVLDVVVVYFFIINTLFLFLLVLAVVAIRRQSRTRPFVGRSIADRFPSLAPPISVIAPAYNEEANIVESIKSFLMLEYPTFQIVVVNDGSGDDTMGALREAFLLEPKFVPADNRLSTTRVRGTYSSRLHPNLFVVDKDNGGKADALNVGISFAEYDLICSVDSDSLLEKDALLRVAGPFIEDPTRTIASGGTVRVANGSTVRYGRVEQSELPRSFLPIVQVVEYTRAFLCGRVGWNTLNSTLIISGAFGLFSKKAVTEVGGYREGCIGEDMDLVVRLHKRYTQLGKPYSVVFVPDPVCWTEAPTDFSTLYRQRNRWQRGLAAAIFSNWDMILNPRYGWKGMLAMPYYVVAELLGPIFEVVSLLLIALGYALGIIDGNVVGIFFVVGVLYGLSMSVIAIMIEQVYFSRFPRLDQYLRLVLAAAVESIGYRQLTALWRGMGLINYVRGQEGWGSMRRAGFRKPGGT